MSKLVWTPWRRVVQVRDDLKSGELSLAMFAADLYDVVMGRARPVYQDPKEFFALTYPTFNLRELAKDIALRLAGRSKKAVRQLELTYGGGKTHALITLYHLARDPAGLPNLPAVQEFRQHIGIVPPKARVAALAFDRLDPVTGMAVGAPDGTSRRFKYPWSVLAYQLGGQEGLEVIGSTGAEEREEPPFTNVLEDLLGLPGKEDLTTLVLIDEVLMWARTKIGADAVWRHRVQDFFQCLTQAATKVDRCAIVASLLATDPSKSDTLGKEITSELYAIFRREREEGVQPVLKEDVTEVLRRRFFTPESIRDREAFRPHVVAALRGIAELDEQTGRDVRGAEEHFLRSYPFHPDLTDIFYSKWTNMESFQRTRGILRTFALALRDAEKWDEGPLIAANVFLGEAGGTDISEAARELTTVASTPDEDGKRPDWAGILAGELAKARSIQQDFPGLRQREVEQAVVGTFLHSQPIGQKALARELLALLGHTRPDKIELEQALRRWSEESWFLDEAAIGEAEIRPDGQKLLPKSWRLGPKANLRQMHHDARERVPAELVEGKLGTEIAALKNLTAGASAAGAKVHNLPDRPRDVEDDGEFHYVVLGPKAASDPGKASAEARRFIEETTAADRPRVCRNSLVLAVPSRDGADAARTVVRDYLGWEGVREQLKGQPLDLIREQMLATYVEGARKKIPEAIQQAYCIAVAVSEKNEIEAFKIAAGSGPLFSQIKADSHARIQDSAISAEALLPEGPYALWGEGETSRRAKDLVGAFAYASRLPKMLSRKAILDTLVAGCAGGSFVIRLTRPDRSAKTFWREPPDDIAMKDPSLEVVLPEAAALSDISPSLLTPGALPGLWQTPEITLRDVCEYFSGQHVVKATREGYEEPVTIPRAERETIEAAVRGAVKSGKLWLTAGPASVLGEEIPAGLLADDAILQGPPAAISPLDLLPPNLTEVWSEETATALAMVVALSRRSGKPLPWETIRKAIESALSSRLLERTLDSGPWPCDYSGAQAVKLRLPSAEGQAAGYGVAGRKSKVGAAEGSRVLMAEAELRPNEIQDLADQIAEITKLAVGLDVKFRLRVELGGATQPAEEVVARINLLLHEVSEELRLQ